jgi:type VI secretion system secreted protein VgrG
MPGFAHTNRLLSFTSPLGSDVLLAERFSGVEGVSELFRYDIELLADAATSVDPKNIVGQKVCLSIDADGSGTQRYFNGIVASFETAGSDAELNSFRAVVVPKLWLLTLNVNTRVFQDKTALDVIKAVLSPYGISPKEDTSGTYQPLEYCTQYRETDFDFVSRLMEQFGIFYYFVHSSDDHQLVLQDTSTKLSDCAIQNTFRYSPQGSDKEGYYDLVVEEARSRSTLVTGKHTAWDYSFIRYMAVPDGGGKAETKGPLGANSHEQYDYADSAAAYLKKQDSDTKIGDNATFFAQVRRDSCDAGTAALEGVSNAIPMSTGYTFTLSEHPQASLNVKYLLLRVEHRAQQIPSYRSRTDTPRPYSNSFTAIPFSIVYRPPFVTKKPVVHGMHTAKVVAASGDESHMDKYGRACVQFFWDRERKDNTVDNTWVRVAQQWAGKGWGTYFWPREGDEVLIDFMEGDPDQPIVVGSLYNGVNMPKYDPSSQYTLAGVLTRSSKDGGAANANELRFEDLKGKEQIFMNAEKDYDLHVENDWHTLVGNEQHTQVGSNQFEQVGGDSHFTLGGKQYHQVGADAHLSVGADQVVLVGGNRSHTVGGEIKEEVGTNYGMTVGQNLVQEIGQNHSLLAGQNQQVMAGQNCNVTAGMNINLMGGLSVKITGGAEGVSIVGPGGFISITPAGVAIMGTMVMINSGGGPSPAQSAETQTPATPDSPTAPKKPQFPGDAPPSKASS